MAKTIKFNLILNQKPVRDLDDLRNNFSIEDILELYNNGLLKKWLKVREYGVLLDEVDKIETESNMDIIKQLIKIFEIEIDNKKIEEGVAILGYIDERMIQLEEFRKINFKTQSIINDYHSGYDALINDIIENKDDMPKIKANIKEIENNYFGLFNLNYRDLYNSLIINAPLSVFAMLMNDKMRQYLIDSETSNENTKLIYKKINEFVANKIALKERLGAELKIFKGNTEAYWKDIEPKEKKLMIINMEAGNFVRNSGKHGEDLTNIAVNNLYLLVDGIDYKSNNANQELLYMEV